jgi:hypothetical protein
VRRSLLALVAAASLAAAAQPGAHAAPAAGCGSGAHGKAGYGYAGHQSARPGHGIRATVTPLAAPAVGAGHVAGWVGVGGRGEGPGGSDQWLQVGLASVPGAPLLLYVEVTRPGREPVFRLVDEGAAAGEPRRLAVLELAGRPGWWRAWADGRPVTPPVHLPGSSGRLRPIATAESWDGGSGGCNAFAFRFEDVAVAAAGGGSWRAFLPGHRFLDAGFRLRRLAPAGRAAARALAARPLRPYAFLAASGRL